MNSNKLSGLFIGAILGFVFIITCTSPVVSEENESNDTINENGRYAISTHMVKESSLWYYHEVIIDTRTGEVISRKAKDYAGSTLNGFFDYLN